MSPILGLPAAALWEIWDSSQIFARCLISPLPRMLCRVKRIQRTPIIRLAAGQCFIILGILLRSILPSLSTDRLCVTMTSRNVERTMSDYLARFGSTLWSRSCCSRLLSVRPPCAIKADIRDSRSDVPLRRRIYTRLSTIRLHL